jgi:hypothetical protein
MTFDDCFTELFDVANEAVEIIAQAFEGLSGGLFRVATFVASKSTFTNVDLSNYSHRMRLCIAASDKSLTHLSKYVPSVDNQRSLLDDYANVYNIDFDKIFLVALRTMSSVIANMNLSVANSHLTKSTKIAFHSLALQAKRWKEKGLNSQGGKI